jgi:clan AA aspartic protease
MITGVVNVKGEAILRVVVSDLATQRIVIDAVIDTGYNGFLTLPSSTIVALGLRWRGSEDVILGDGSVHKFDAYAGRIIWDGEYRIVKIHESNTDSLLGVGMLYGYELCIETIDGGMVKIKALEKRNV